MSYIDKNNRDVLGTNITLLVRSHTNIPVLTTIQKYKHRNQVAARTIFMQKLGKTLGWRPATFTKHTKF
jgi:hypothetical protein